MNLAGIPPGEFTRLTENHIFDECRICIQQKSDRLYLPPTLHLTFAPPPFPDIVFSFTSLLFSASWMAPTRLPGSEVIPAFSYLRAGHLEDVSLGGLRQLILVSEALHPGEISKVLSMAVFDHMLR